MEKMLGITEEREFPAFATQTFRQWWAARGGVNASRENAREARERRGEPVDADGRILPWVLCEFQYT